MAFPNVKKPITRKPKKKRYQRENSRKLKSVQKEKQKENKQIKTQEKVLISWKSIKKITKGVKAMKTKEKA